MNSYQHILDRLAVVRRKETRQEVLIGLSAWVLALLGTIFVVSIAERLFGLDSSGRTILFGVMIAGAAASFAWFAGKPLLKALGILKGSSYHEIALKVGNHFPGVRDRLLDVIELYENREKLAQNYSVELIDASFSDLYEASAPLNFSQAVDSVRMRRLGRMVMYAAGVFVLMFAIPQMGLVPSMYRVLRFDMSFAAPAAIEFSIEPGNAEIVRGESLPVTIHTSGKHLATILLHTRQSGQLEFDSQTLTPMPDGAFHAHLDNLKSTTEYFASAKEVKSAKYLINVLDRPFIKSFTVTVTPPRYTRIPPKTQDQNLGDINAYPGSRIEFTLTSSKAVVSAQIAFHPGQPVTMTAAGLEATGGFTVKDNTMYHFVLRDNTGLTNVDPIEYTVHVIPDEAPTVEITSPGKNVDVTDQMSIDLQMQLKDDFGFSKLRLAYRLAHSRYEPAQEQFLYIDIPMARLDQTPYQQDYHWDLKSLNLVPEDAVAYYAEVFDNDNVNGPKSGKSETFILRLPSLDEVFSDVAKTHDQSEQSLEGVSKEEQNLKKDVEQMQQELQKNQEKMDWQQKKKTEEMLQRFETMKNNLDSAQHKLDDAVKKMQDNNLLSEKTMQDYAEMQKLMEQLKSPELQAALKKLQEAMKNQQPMTPDQMKQAMQQLKQTEEQFRKNLERTVALLKRIHIEQKLDELVKRADELKKQQDELQKETANADSNDAKKRSDLAQKQDDLKSQADSLKKEANDLKDKMGEFAQDMPMDQMQKAEEQMSQGQISQPMSQSSQQMRSGKMSSSQQSQQTASKELQKLSQDLQSAQQEMNEKQQKEVLNKMRQQLENVLELSKREEGLRDETKTIDPNSQRFRDAAEKQDETMDDLGNVANSMGELSKKTFAVSPDMGKEVGSALKDMGEALKNMEERNPGSSSAMQSDAMSSLNRAAIQMGSAMQAMQQGGSGGMGMAGLMSRLGQMSGEQGGINQSTEQLMQGMGQGGNGQQMTPTQQAEAQRLGSEQGSLQERLKKLAEEAKKSGDFSKLLGDLDKVADQMKEVQTDLSQGNVNPETVQKQDRILSRLLDSQRSTRERDFEQRRKSASGKDDIQRSSPADFDVSTQQGKDKLHQEMLKILQGKYSKDYEDLIKKYFDELEQEKVNN